jgi:hypothetical protein
MRSVASQAILCGYRLNIEQIARLSNYPAGNRFMVGIPDLASFSSAGTSAGI